MRKRKNISVSHCPAALFLQMAGIAMYGQDRPRAASKRAQRHQTDTLNTVVNRDSLTVADSLAAETSGRCWK